MRLTRNSAELPTEYQRTSGIPLTTRQKIAIHRHLATLPRNRWAMYLALDLGTYK